MEPALNGDLPLYAEQVHLPLGVVSLSLASFVFGSLIFQLPLGYLGDRLGRRMVLIGCSTAGGVLFSLLTACVRFKRDVCRFMLPRRSIR
ncbi:MFS transporter [Ferroacidibacillus organovorans]|uniref:MFS transporter n=1 Tax=Ferroacidibacillus organovorans TaxID=1765683 RepID=UPI0012E7188C